MKKKSYFLSLFLFLCFLSLAGCAGKEERTVKKTVKAQLEQLKDFDSAVVQDCISTEELLPEELQDEALSQELADIFSLFYQDFSYRIKEVSVEENQAHVTAKIKTLDAKALAKDFSKAALKEQIKTSVSSSDTFSLEESCVLLKDLIKSGEYETVSLTTDIQLQKNQENWEIIPTKELDSTLTGNFLKYATDAKLLSPKEIVKVHFDAMKSFNPQELRTYLHLDSILNTDQQYQTSMGEALAKQISKHFSYKILEETSDSAQAVVQVSITSVDFHSIINSYKKKVSKWLKTSEALSAGTQGRREKEREILISCIEKNKKTSSQKLDIHLVNDGVNWKIQMDDEISNALLGDAKNAVAAISGDVA